MTATVTPRRIGRHLDAVLDRVVDDLADLGAVLVMRRVFGVLVIAHLWPIVTADPLAIERFHVPWWSWVPVPGPGVYRGLLVTGIVAGGLMAAGPRPRPATVVALGVVGWVLVVDLTGFGHNRAFLLWMLFGLALVPHRRLRSPDRTGPAWPITLLRVIVTSVYLTSGATKLVNPTWIDGTVLHERIVWYADEIPAAWLADLATARWFAAAIAPAAIATELFLAVGLWWRRSRQFAVAVAVAFHVAIEVTASVQIFSYAAITALLLWVDVDPDGVRIGTWRPTVPTTIRRSSS